MGLEAMVMGSLTGAAKYEWTVGTRAIYIDCVVFRDFILLPRSAFQ